MLDLPRIQLHVEEVAELEEYHRHHVHRCLALSLVDQHTWELPSNVCILHPAWNGKLTKQCRTHDGVTNAPPMTTQCPPMTRQCISHGKTMLHQCSTKVLATLY